MKAGFEVAFFKSKNVRYLISSSLTADFKTNLDLMAYLFLFKFTRFTGKCGLLSLVLFSSYSAANAQKGKIAPFPQELSVHAGETFEVTWWVHPGDEPVAAIDFVLHYDKHTIEPLNIVKVESPLNINQIKPYIDKDEGRIIYAAFKLDQPWPEIPFPLMKLELKALDTTGVSTLYHDPGIQPNTAMAFEGRSTMKEAYDLQVTILTDENLVSDFSPDLELTSIKLEEESGYYSCMFNSESTGDLEISVRQKEKITPDFLWNTRVKSGGEYRYLLNTDIMPSGDYILTMRGAGGVKAEREVSFRNEEN